MNSQKSNAKGDDMGFWAVAGPIIGQVLGGAASGLSNSGGGGDSRNTAVLMEHQANVNRDYQNWYIQNYLPRLMRESKRNGIHPLTMLGVPPTSSGVNPISINEGPSAGRQALAGALQGAGQGIEQFYKNKRTPEEIEAVNVALDIEREKLKNYKLQNIGMARDISKTLPTVGGQTLLPGQSQTVLPQIMNSQKGDPTATAGLNPSQMYMLGPNEELIKLNDEKLGEALESDMIGNIEMQGSKLVRSYKDTAYPSRPKMTPHELNKNYPKHYVWHNKRNWFGHKRWYAGPPNKRPQHMLKKRPRWVRGYRKLR